MPHYVVCSYNNFFSRNKYNQADGSRLYSLANTDIIYDPDRKQNPEKTTRCDDEEYVDEADFAFTNFSKQKNVTLGKYDPKNEHLVIVPGLNFKAKCFN